jgi:hypothetical protein
VGKTIWHGPQASHSAVELSKKPSHQTKQHPVIPPRIWDYQVSRIETCLQDFNLIKSSLFEIILDIRNAKHKNKIYFFDNQATIGVSTECSIPYFNPLNQTNLFDNKIVFSKSFHEMLDDAGILSVLKRLMSAEKTFTLSNVSTILDGFRDASLAYIQFFSLQRINETLSLHYDCLSVENDERFGAIYILSGVTTKTIENDDAKWIVPKRIELALDIAKEISEFIYQFVPEDLKKILILSH